MTLKKHNRHSQLIKPDHGNFGRLEISLIGAPCDRINLIYQKIANSIGETIRMAFADTDHHPAQTEEKSQVLFIHKGIRQSYDLKNDINKFNLSPFFQTSDLILTNGNHFSCERQILIINKDKKESLSKKLDRLSNIQMIILDEGNSEIYDFLINALPNINKIEVFRIEEIESIVRAILKIVNENIPPLKGLILAGGKSQRMGQDKTKIVYHDKAQWRYSADLLKGFCEQVYISKADENFSDGGDYPIITDTFLNLGPYGGILSAFQTDPNAAWLVLASDIPLINEDAIKMLVKHRNISKYATCFHNEITSLPEPLITIWEPRSYARLLNFLSMGYSCPRKVLINSDVQEIEPLSSDILRNANTPEESEDIKKFLKSL